MMTTDYIVFATFLKFPSYMFEKTPPLSAPHTWKKCGHMGTMCPQNVVILSSQRRHFALPASSLGFPASSLGESGWINIKKFKPWTVRMPKLFIGRAWAKCIQVVMNTTASFYLICRRYDQSFGPSVRSHSQAIWINLLIYLSLQTFCVLYG